MATLQLQQVLPTLEALPFVEQIDLIPGGPGGDARITINTPAGVVTRNVEIKRTHLTHGIVDGILARDPLDAPPLLLVAPYVPPGIAQRLAAGGVDYVDAAGNYRLAIEDRFFAEKLGQKPPRKPAAHREMRLAGYQVLFTLLAQPATLELTVRELADRAGVGKTAAAETLRTLARQGLIGTGAHRQVLDRRELLDRWLAGYTTYVRPRLFIGTYRTRFADPMELEAALLETDLGENTAQPVRWAFGGGAAAYRITRYYRGPTTVVHIDGPAEALLRPIRALEAEDGHLIVLQAPGPVAFEGVADHTAHPLLVYTELYAEGTERARDAARDLAAQHLEDLP